MKLIKAYPQQRYFNIRHFLKNKGYRKSVDFARYTDRVQVLGKWSEMWSLHINRGEQNYMLVRQKESPYGVYIVDFTGEMVTIYTVKHFIETGESLPLKHFTDYVDMDKI